MISAIEKNNSKQFLNSVLFNDKIPAFYHAIALNILLILSNDNYNNRQILNLIDDLKFEVKSYIS